MGLVLYSVIPYSIWLIISIFNYNKEYKKGKDTFQVSQLINIMFYSGGLAFHTTNVDFTRDMLATLIGMYAILYSIYWVICLFIKRKYEKNY